MFFVFSPYIYIYRGHFSPYSMLSYPTYYQVYRNFCVLFPLPRPFLIVILTPISDRFLYPNQKPTVFGYSGGFASLAFGFIWYPVVA